MDGEVNRSKRGAVAKATGPQRASARDVVGSRGVVCEGPEAGRSMPGQAEALREEGGRPTGYSCAHRSVDLGIGVKGQSRPGIAGSPRNQSQLGLGRGRAVG